MIARRVDERGPAAEIDAQQFCPFRVEWKFGAIDRMFGRQSLELRLAGIDPRHQAFDPFVEAGAVAVVDGEDETPLLHVGAE